MRPEYGTVGIGGLKTNMVGSSVGYPSTSSEEYFWEVEFAIYTAI